MKKEFLFIIFTTFILSVIVTTCIIEDKIHNKSLKILQKRIDSLNVEINTLNIELNRYDYIIERAQDEMAQPCKDELETIISQTE